jgi:hypothetical protein
MKAWLTAYAISRGVELVECKPYPYTKERVTVNSRPFETFIFGKDIYGSRAEAIVAAKLMRDKRLAALRKQIAKLKKMTFENTPE